MTSVDVDTYYTVAAPRSVLESAFTATEKIVLLAVVHCHATAITSPSIEQLRRSTSLSKRAVQRALKTLAATGRLIVIRSAGPGLTNTYALGQGFPARGQDHARLLFEMHARAGVNAKDLIGPAKGKRRA